AKHTDRAGFKISIYIFIVRNAVNMIGFNNIVQTFLPQKFAQIQKEVDVAVVAEQRRADFTVGIKEAAHVRENFVRTRAEVGNGVIGKNPLELVKQFFFNLIDQIINIFIM